MGQDGHTVARGRTKGGMHKSWGGGREGGKEGWKEKGESGIKWGQEGGRKEGDAEVKVRWR